MPEAERVTVTDDTLTAELSDGRTISVPLAWYPRLIHATPEERGRWELHAAGQHIHWPDLDEDLSVEGLLAGRPSGEGPGVIPALARGEARRPAAHTRRPLRPPTRGRGGEADEADVRRRVRADPEQLLRLCA